MENEFSREIVSGDYKHMIEILNNAKKNMDEKVINENLQMNVLKHIHYTNNELIKMFEEQK